MTLVSLTDYGAQHEVSRQAAAKWKTRGYLVCKGELIDVEASDARRRAHGKGGFNQGASGRERRREMVARNHPQPSTTSATRRQVAPSAAPQPEELVETRPWSCRADEVSKAGTLAGLVYLGHKTPALAVEAALRHGRPRAAARALFEEGCASVERAVEAELRLEDISTDDVCTWTEGAALFEPDDWTRPAS